MNVIIISGQSTVNFDSLFWALVQNPLKPKKNCFHFCDGSSLFIKNGLGYPIFKLLAVIYLDQRYKTFLVCNLRIL
jgi:hypothetical protein